MLCGAGSQTPLQRLPDEWGRALVDSNNTASETVSKTYELNNFGNNRVAQPTLLEGNAIMLSRQARKYAAVGITYVVLFDGRNMISLKFKVSGDEPEGWDEI